MTSAPTWPTTMPEAAAPAAWVCLDIETANGDPATADEAMRREWTPDKRWADETIGRRYKAALAKKTERLALIDASPICIVAWRDAHTVRLMHTLDAHEARSEHGATCAGYPDQASMLAAWRDAMDAITAPDTTLAGWNIIGFDLPRLRWAYIRHGVRLPRCLAAQDQSVIDLMRLYTSRYSTSSATMHGLGDALEGWALASHKSTISGGDVPELARRAQAGDAPARDGLLRYSVADVNSEADLFLRMTGQFGQ